MRRALLAGMVWLAAVLAAGAAAPRFAQDCARLTAGPHRLVGSAEGRRASAYVAERLRGIGVDAVIEQPFPVPTLVTRACTLTAGATTIRLAPMRPNGIIPPVTPPGGITGELLYAGMGALTEYPASPDGKIVVLDYNAGSAWLRAFRLGARAVIFTQAGTGVSSAAHYVEAQANFPRYYYPGPARNLPLGQTVTVRADVVWQPGTGHNVYGVIAGSSAEKEMASPLILAAALDTFGEAPDLTPGARGAANVAALLVVGERLVAQRPGRTVVLAFLDGEAFGHAGAKTLYRILEKDARGATLADRQKAYADECASLEEMLTQVASVDSLAPGSTAYLRVRDRLKLQAAARVFGHSNRIEDLNKVGMQLRKTPDDPRALAARQEIEELQKRKDPANGLRRAISHDDMAAARGGALAPLFRETVDAVRRDLLARRAELDVIGGNLRADAALRDALGHAPVLAHCALMLGDTTERWGFIIGGDSDYHSTEDRPGLYGKLQGALLKTLPQATPRLFEPATIDGKLDSRLFWAGPLVHSGEVAGRMGVYNMVVGTIQEALPREGTPDDTPALTDLGRMEAQAHDVATLLAVALQARELGVGRTIKVDRSYVVSTVGRDGKLQGPTVRGVGAGSAMPNVPVPGVVIQTTTVPRAQYAYAPRKLPGFVNADLQISDRNAAYGWGPLPTNQWNSTFQTFGVQFDDRGEPLAVSDKGGAGGGSTRLNLFPCAATAVKSGEVVYARRYGALVLTPQVDAGEAQILQGVSNGPLNPAKANFGTQDGVAFWYCERQVEDVKVVGVRAAVAMANGPASSDHRITARDFTGDGFTLLAPEWRFPTTVTRSAADLWRMDEHRMDLLRKYGVMNSSLEDLHGTADDLLAAADAETRMADREPLASASFLVERAVYDNLRRSLDDLVRAVLILLALAIPFAFALERLLVGATSIYRQLAWFIVFFLVTFAILFFVHPAFVISSQPVVIFLAFALLVLSALVIFVIMQKFEVELKVLQGLTSSVHSADVSRMSTMMAAMAMGISTMRRRPLRTALTALTITLLTFTILNFASFDTQMGIVSIYQEGSPRYAGVLLRKANWGALDEDLLPIVARAGGEQATLTCRYWLCAEAAGTTPAVTLPLLTRGDGTHPAELRGVLGLDPGELSLRGDLAEAFGVTPEALGTDGICLTATQARALGVQAGDAVILGGISLRVAALLDGLAVSRLRDMDGSGVLPVDFNVMSGAQKSSQTATAATSADTGADLLAKAMAKQDWVELPVDKVVVVSGAVAQRLGARLRGMTLYTGTDIAAAVTAGESLARMLALPVMITRKDGVYVHVLAPTVQATGVKDLLFPILLGGLVIFGTMLGSVADREKEIYTFSALGLAPPHITTLFLAEAMIYSVIGGMGGYLLAQGFMRLMGVLARLGIASMPEMNYSSLNAIVTILIVMATVLASAIYPAFKASRSANPGVLRAWRPPAPEGDLLAIVFPFTVSSYDLRGVIGFLKEHFDNFGEAGLGVFLARDTEIVRRGASLGIRATLALAPFDLGVTQSFELYNAPSEIEGIDEVKIEIQRLSGQQKDWERLNKVLLDELRRQFLLWRALPQETMELYRQRTMAAVGEEAPAGEAVATPT